MNISHMFGSWLNGFRRDVKPLLLLRAATTCWSLWLRRNDLVFEKNMFLLSCRALVVNLILGLIIINVSGFPFVLVFAQAVCAFHRCQE
jgi:hypothetical protein